MSWSIQKINENMVTNTQLQLGLHELADLMNRISSQQNTMSAFADNIDYLEKSTLISFAEWTVNPSNLAIQGLLDRIDLLMTGSPDLATIGNQGILYLIADNLKVNILLYTF